MCKNGAWMKRILSIGGEVWEGLRNCLWGQLRMGRSCSCGCDRKKRGRCSIPKPKRTHVLQISIYFSLQGRQLVQLHVLLLHLLPPVRLGRLADDWHPLMGNKVSHKGTRSPYGNYSWLLVYVCHENVVMTGFFLWNNTCLLMRLSKVISTPR